LFIARPGTSQSLSMAALMGCVPAQGWPGTLAWLFIW
jgi:hypothetical protein